MNNPTNPYVAKNPENPLEELLQMADLIGCPEELITSEYNTFINDAVKPCPLGRGDVTNLKAMKGVYR